MSNGLHLTDAQWRAVIDVPLGALGGLLRLVPLTPLEHWYRATLAFLSAINAEQQRRDP